MKRGKNYRGVVAKIEMNKIYILSEAIDIAKNTQRAKFDESIDVAINLNLKKSHSFRGVLSFPHRFGKETRILVFAKGEYAQEAEKSGADYVGSEDLVEKIKDGFLDFDVAVATPDLMPLVGKLGPILGRRGLMPNPKTQTVTRDIKRTVQALKKGRLEYKADKEGVLHFRMGKCSMNSSALYENFNELLSEVSHRRPVDVKGNFIKSIFISTTMGPSVRIDALRALEDIKK